MKTGCFIKSVIILTILVASILYIIQNKMDDFVLNPGKNIVHSFLQKKVDKELVFVKDSPQKDSLKIMIDSYLKNLKKLSEFSDDSIKSIIDSVKISIVDSTITENELKKLSKYLLKKSENERTKINGN